MIVNVKRYDVSGDGQIDQKELANMILAMVQAFSIDMPCFTPVFTLLV